MDRLREKSSPRSDEGRIAIKQPRVVCRSPRRGQWRIPAGYGGIVVLFMCLAACMGQARERIQDQVPPPAVQDSVIYAKAGILLPVHVKIPPDHDPSRPAILVVALHGKGGTAQGMLPMWNAFNNPQFILAVPEAPYPLSGGWSWDFPSRDPKLWEIADPLISDYILSIITDIKARHQISAVYLFGHSQGVGYVYLTGLLHPGQVRGAVCFAGIYPQEFLPSDKVKPAVGAMRFFIAHGIEDPLIGVNASEQAKDILQGMGAAVHLLKFKGGHNLPSDALREAQKWIEADLPQREQR